MKITNVNSKTIEKAIVARLEQGSILYSGFRKLEERIGFFRKGNMYVIGGRPGMGKSTLALDIACQVSVQEGEKVVYVSLDWNTNTVLLKILKRKMTEREDAASAFHIFEERNLTIEELVYNLERNSLLKDTAFLVVDYLQVMHSEKPFSSRSEELDYVCKQLKDIARTMDICVLVLSELNRKVEERLDSRPMLSDLKGSEAIEEYADTVMLLYRDDYYYPEDYVDEEAPMEIIHYKNINGFNGTDRIWFRAKHGKYSETPGFMG